MTLRRVLAFASEILAVILVGLFALALAYLLGSGMLLGNLQGNDSPLHVGYAEWLDQYFPDVPHWYPLQGAGSSLVHAYPVLSHLFLVMLGRITELSLLQGYRAISFLSLSAIAIGIYAFGRMVLRSRTIGFVSMFLFLISPISWTWIYNWGFYAQQVALIFLAPSLIAFDRTLAAATAKPKIGGGRRLWFVALAVLVLLATLSHMLVGVAAWVGMLLYTVFFCLLSQRHHRRSHLVGGLKILLLLGVIVGLVAAAYLVPFYNYNQFANRNGANAIDPETLHRLPIAHFFGFREIDEFEILTRMQFPLIVTIGGLLGLVLSGLQSRVASSQAKKPLAIALTTLFATIFAITPELPALILKASPLLVNFLNFRSMLMLVMILLPLLAGYGFVTLVRFVFLPESFAALMQGGDYKSVHFLQRIRHGFSAGAAILLVALAVVVLGRMLLPGGNHLPYGPTKVDFEDIWDSGNEGVGLSLGQQISLSNWPSPVLSDNDRLTEISKSLAAQIPAGESRRVDTSPYEGRLAMDLVSFADVSQINSYTFTASIIHNMWGYQQKVFYSNDTPVSEYGNPVSLDNTASWFGTEYVFLDEELDNTEIYAEAGWELEFDDSQVQIWLNPSAPQLAQVIDRPVILVISKPESDGYATLFRLANDGMLPFSDALLVEGASMVDSYSVEELARFDAVILHGYDYENSNKAWSVLESYVTNGGSLYVDTGWEFWVPEWEFETAPNVLPVDSIWWTDYGLSDNYSLGSQEIVGEVDETKFKPLVWEGSPWTLSGSARANVRSWGTIALSANENPLIVAGELGQGRVVWSGMNLVSHAQYLGKNEEEIDLLGNLIGWLIANERASGEESVVVDRDHPDKIDFSLSLTNDSRSWLLWREAYYPRWQAELIDSNDAREIPVYSAGPGLMLMPLETNQDFASVSLQWKPSLLESAAILGTVVGLLFLGANIVDGLLLRGDGLSWLKIAVLTRTPWPFLGDGDNEDWARRKRRELETGEELRSPMHYKATDAIPWLRDQEPPVSDEIGDESKEVAETGNGAHGDRDQEELLESWLKSTGHEEDDWANRLLDEKEKDEEN